MMRRWLRSWLGIERPTFALFLDGGAYKVMRRHHELHVTDGEALIGWGCQRSGMRSRSQRRAAPDEDSRTARG